MTMVAELRETRFDPLLARQALLRRLWEANAHPGLIIRLGEIPLHVPVPRLRPACALLLAVLDREASFHVRGPDGERLREYLRFNTGAYATSLESADFVLVTGSAPGGGGSRRGRLETFQDGATVVCAPFSVSTTPAGADVTMSLHGPGIAGERRLSVQGLTGADLAPLFTGDHSSLGVDLWLAAADGHLAVIPRSTRCRE